MKIAAIIQARTGSTRLPKKVFMKLNGVSLLQSLINQLSYSKKLENKIIATTDKIEDDIIEEFARSQGIYVFRGNEIDVLDRYYQCAKYFAVRHIIRISGDAPLIDPEIIDDVINFYEKNNFDYVNNFYKRTFPIGTEVEVFNFETLEKTWKKAKKPSEREHVTSYIYNNQEKFSVGYIEYKENLSNLHYTVDRKEDLDFVRAIYKRIQKKPILLRDILAVIEEDPSILELNKNTVPDEGYVKSLQEDERTKSN